MRGNLVQHTESRSRCGQDILILGVNESNCESIDTKVLAEATSNVYMILQPVIVSLVLLILLNFVLIEPDLGHRLHLLLFVKRNSIKLVTDQVNLFLICPFEAHLKALRAHHFTRWGVWLRE